MTDRVRITDVSPRDGLQNEPGVIPTDEKLRLVRAVIDSGVDEVEVTSFVSPKWIPQLGDAAALLESLAAHLRAGGITPPLLSALVPNEKGMASLVAANASAGSGPWGERLIGKASVFTAASESFSLRNTNASIAETIDRFGPVLALCKAQGILVRGYVSCVIACPFEGPIEPGAVVDVARRLVEIGVDEIDLGDTIGAADLAGIERLLKAFEGESGSMSVRSLTVHLHDTFGRAGACARKAMEMGVRSFDGSAGGLGGCPYASTPDRRAPGNISTDLLVTIARELGLGCSVDLDALRGAGAIAQAIGAGGSR